MKTKKKKNIEINLKCTVTVQIQIQTREISFLSVQCFLIKYGTLSSSLCHHLRNIFSFYFFFFYLFVFARARGPQTVSILSNIVWILRLSALMVRGYDLLWNEYVCHKYIYVLTIHDTGFELIIFNIYIYLYIQSTSIPT